jgi:hypothetical protein
VSETRSCLLISLRVSTWRARRGRAPQSRAPRQRKKWDFRCEVSRWDFRCEISRTWKLGLITLNWDVTIESWDSHSQRSGSGAASMMGPRCALHTRHPGAGDGFPTSTGAGDRKSKTGSNKRKRLPGRAPRGNDERVSETRSCLLIFLRVSTCKLYGAGRRKAERRVKGRNGTSGVRFGNKNKWKLVETRGLKLGIRIRT